MHGRRNFRGWLLRTVLFCVLVLGASGGLCAESGHGAAPNFPTPVESYADDSVTNLGEKLAGRIAKDPFNLVATLIFFLAIVHTFLAGSFSGIAHRLDHEYTELRAKQDDEGGDAVLARAVDRKKLLSVVFHFLGEVEVVFGIWLIPLTAAMFVMKGAGTAKTYLNGVNFTEPIFVAVIMAVAGSRPILSFAEGCLSSVAKVGGATPAAWWVAILTLGPVLGSFITEPAAMTICAMLLAARFYRLRPSMTLCYATLGLLFVNISVGGTLTHFAAPPVVMVAAKWNWDLAFMFEHFGWRAVVGIVIANAIVFLAFRRELLSLKAVTETGVSARRLPWWIIATHLGFIGAIVYVAHYAAVVVLLFMLFLGFVMATANNQSVPGLKSPVLVGLFLAGLVIHGGCQQWWIEPVLKSLNPLQLLFGSTVLTAFNDNAAITYLASLVQGFSDEAKYSVVAGAVIGGGLTVIANAPNPAGQALLKEFFGERGVEPAKLFLAALGPTIVMLLAFLFLP